MMKANHASPKVSIVIINYNYAQYVDEAIKSALDQKYDVTEVVIVDDGSTDDSREKILKYKSKKISHYFKNNGGPSSARNYGARKASGEYIIFLDADDTLARNYIDDTLEEIKKYDKKSIGFIYTQLQHFGADNKVTIYPSYDKSKLIESNFIAVTCLLRRSLIIKYPFDESLHSWEDWDFYLTLAEKNIQGVLIDKPLLNYRRHPEISSNLDTQNKFDKTYLRHRLYAKHWRLYSRRVIIRHYTWYLLYRIRHVFDWNVNY